jgi:hypothetical protein
MGTFAIKGRSPLNELLDGCRAFFDKRANSLRIAEPIPSTDGVLLVQLNFIVVTDRSCDSALGVLGRRLA